MSRTISFRSVEVSDSVQQIVAFNSKRTNLIIRNETGSIVYISSDEKDVIEKGYPIYTGEYIAMSDVDKDAVMFGFYARTATGTAKLKIIEEFEV